MIITCCEGVRSTPPAQRFDHHTGSWSKVASEPRKSRPTTGALDSGARSILSVFDLDMAESGNFQHARRRLVYR